MTEGGAGAVERQRGGVCGSVKRVCGGVRGGVQRVRGSSVRVRLQRRRCVLQDDHRPRLPLPLGMGVAPRWRITELLEPRLCPWLEAGPG